jgi:Phage integrase family
MAVATGTRGRVRAVGSVDRQVVLRTAAPSSVDNHAQECWAVAELKPITLHEARHTFASLLIDSGANAKAIQEFMGHSKIQTTFDTYGHLLPGSHDEVRERMDAYLLRRDSGVRGPAGRESGCETSLVPGHFGAHAKGEVTRTSRLACRIESGGSHA